MGAGILHFGTQLVGQCLQVNFLQQLLNCLSAHAYAEAIAIFIASIHVFSLGQKLLFSQGSVARVQHNVVSKVQHLFQITGGYIQNQAHTAGDALKIPNMGNRCSQLNMAHALTTNLAAGNLNAAFIADNTLITNAFIFAAMAFPVLSRAKDSFAEQAITFRL